MAALEELPLKPTRGHSRVAAPEPSRLQTTTATSIRMQKVFHRLLASATPNSCQKEAASRQLRALVPCNVAPPLGLPRIYLYRINCPLAPTHSADERALVISPREHPVKEI